ncbi:MAG: hypothetical protein RBJ76_28145 [Stenomitos frigidus ULC029]
MLLTASDRKKCCIRLAIENGLQRYEAIHTLTVNGNHTIARKPLSAAAKPTCTCCTTRLRTLMLCLNACQTTIRRQSRLLVLEAWHRVR